MSNIKIVITHKGKRVLSNIISGYDYVEGGRIHLINGLSFSCWPPFAREEFLTHMDMCFADDSVRIIDLRATVKQLMVKAEAEGQPLLMDAPVTGAEEGTGK
jgi:hypothetical protein